MTKCHIKNCEPGYLINTCSIWVTFTLKTLYFQREGPAVISGINSFCVYVTVMTSISPWGQSHQNQPPDQLKLGLHYCLGPSNKGSNNRILKAA